LVGVGRWEALALAEGRGVRVAVGCIETSAERGGVNAIVKVFEAFVSGSSTTPNAASRAGNVSVMISPRRLNTPLTGFALARYDGRADQACGPPVCQWLVAG
jgi:hypothetical protein